MPEDNSSRKLLGVWAPPKPVGDMTEEELDAWAEALYDAMKEKLQQED